MRLTFYEVEATMRKAGIGSGLPIGIAEDFGRAVRWLVCHDLPGVEEALKSIASDEVKIEFQRKKEGVVVFPNAKVSVCGPSAIDILIGEKTCNAVHLVDADTAILFIGFVATVGAYHNLAFELTFSNGTTASVFRGQLKTNGPLPSSRCSIIASCYKSEEHRTSATTQKNELEVDNEIWQQAELLAAKTYVPESHASRTSGAGARINDNE